MNKAIRNRRLILAAILIALVCAGAAFYASIGNGEKPPFEKVNERLDADGVGFGMPEEQVVERLGEGTVVKGYGGHFRRYAKEQVDLSFSDDPKSECYGSVCSVAFANPAYRLYDIGVGDERPVAEERLKENGFERVDGHLYRKGHFVVSLGGQEQVERIQVAYVKGD